MPPVSICAEPPGGTRKILVFCRVPDFETKNPGKFANMPLSSIKRHAAVIAFVELPKMCSSPMP